MKARKFMPWLAAAFIAVLTLAVAGTGSAKSDVAATKAATPIKVALITDVGGLDDKSFNFLANRGLTDAKKRLGIQVPSLANVQLCQIIENCRNHRLVAFPGLFCNL